MIRLLHPFHREYYDGTDRLCFRVSIWGFAIFAIEWTLAYFDLTVLGFTLEKND